MVSLERACLPSALCLWHGAFHILTLLMWACHWMHATCQQPPSDHLDSAFLLVVEDVFVSFFAGHGPHVSYHEFCLHMSHMHSGKDTLYMHLHATSWWCSSLWLRTGVSMSCALPSAQQPDHSRGRWGCGCRGVCPILYSPFCFPTW